MKTVVISEYKAKAIIDTLEVFNLQSLARPLKKRYDAQSIHLTGCKCRACQYDYPAKERIVELKAMGKSFDADSKEKKEE